MTRRLSAAVLLAAVLAAVPADLVAQGWTQPRGRGYYKLGVSAIRASSYFDPGGTRIDIPTLSDYTVQFYGEHGLIDRLTAVVNVPFFKRITLNRQVARESGFEFFEGDAVNGFADPEVGIRVGLLQNRPTVLSVDLSLGLPLGSDRHENGLLTGDGELNQKAVLGIGHSFYPVPAFAQASIGFNNRIKGYSDEVLYSLQAGYTFAGRITAIARLRGLESLENGDDAISGGTGGLYANNQQYLSMGVEVAYTLPAGYGVAFGVDGATSARNQLAAPAFSLGLFLAR